MKQGRRESDNSQRKNPRLRNDKGEAKLSLPKHTNSLFSESILYCQNVPPAASSTKACANSEQREKLTFLFQEISQRHWKRHLPFRGGRPAQDTMYQSKQCTVSTKAQCVRSFINPWLLRVSRCKTKWCRNTASNSPTLLVCRFFGEWRWVTFRKGFAIRLLSGFDAILVFKASLH